jgi:hypothetical protein
MTTMCEQPQDKRQAAVWQVLAVVHVVAAVVVIFEVRVEAEK